MIYDPYVWFNPVYMIHCGVEATKHLEQSGIKVDSDMRKALNEAFAVSVMSLGINKLHNMQLRVQLVDPNERSPDMRVMYEVSAESEKFGHDVKYWDVEIVTLEKHSDIQVDQFIKETKFSAKKAYDRETIILCYIDRDITNGKPWREVSVALKTLNLPNNVFVLGKVHPSKPVYHIARVNPIFDSILEFDVMEEAKKKYDKPGGTLFVSNKGRTIKRKLRRGICPFLED